MSASEDAVKGPGTPSAEDVRRILNRWSGEGFFRARRLGDLAQIEEIRTLASYTVQLRSQYEDRSVSRVSRPHEGGAVDDHGTPPGLWDVPVPAPDDFADRTEKRPVPHTERVEPCPTCQGVGSVTCSPCSGTGKVNCPFCQGKGYRERTEFRSTPGPGGQTQTQAVQVRDPCTCMAGKVNCGFCGGRGRNPCKACAGGGRVVTSDELTVQFRATSTTEVVNTTDIPEQHLKQATGVVLIDKQAGRIETAPAVVPEVDKLTADLLHKSQGEADGTRLLFQRLHVEQVGVHEVSYRYSRGPARRLWIYGDKESVHTPGAPRAWLRILAVLGGVAAAVAVVGYLLFAFVLRQ